VIASWLASVLTLPALGDLPLLWLLVAGHLWGDFLFQSRWMVQNKHRPGVLVFHALTVIGVHATVVAPLLSGPVALAVGCLGGVHLVIDRVKVGLSRSREPTLRLWIADQVAHLASIGLATWVVQSWAPPSPHVEGETLAAWTTACLVAGVFAFAWTGGNGIVKATLVHSADRMEADDDPANPEAGGIPGSGRTIGMLERTIALVLILLGEWAALVLLVAVKSIARFEALKERRFAEYYLIGTLTSLLVAILAGLFLRAILQPFGG
jgi:hypothetical protein